MDEFSGIVKYYFILIKIRCQIKDSGFLNERATSILRENYYEPNAIALGS
ncbi:MAG: hypothetical protein H0U45_03995 [Tatlockia sp.]|nr:hypothetical protein [Tatlockia sp.]